MPDYPQIVILLGPNGVGKTTLGQMLERNFSCAFLSLETLLLERYPSYEVYRANRPAAYRAFEQAVGEQVMASTVPLVFEEVGLNEVSQHLIGNLQARFRVALVRVTAPEEVCQQRVARRDPASNYPKSPAFVRDTYHRFAATARRFTFTLEAQNLGRQPDELAEAFSGLLPPRE